MADGFGHLPGFSATQYDIAFEESLKNLCILADVYGSPSALKQGKGLEIWTRISSLSLLVDTLNPR